MRVGYFVETPVEKNLTGGSRSFLDLITNLIPMGVEPYVVVSEEWALTERLAEMGVPYITARMFRPFVGVEDKAKFYRLKYLIKLLINGIAKRKAGKFFQENVVQFVHINSQFCGVVGAQVAKKMKIPYIYHIRENLQLGFDVQFYNQKKADKLIGDSHVIIAISDMIKREACHRFPKSNIVRIYNGITVNSLNRTQNSIFFDEEIRMVIVGRVCDNKNQMDAIRAIEIVKNTTHYRPRLYIVGYNGTDPYELELVHYVQEHELSDVIQFVPFTDSPNDVVRTCDVGLMCSKNEAFGRVTVEYMMAGLLTIGAKCSGTLELIKDGETGLFYELHHPEELAKHICWVIKHREQARVIAQNGFFRAVDEFNVLTTAKNVWSLYEKIV